MRRDARSIRRCYAYDSLHRLTQAVATGNATYNLAYYYDQWGNMTCTLNGQTQGPCPQMTYSTSNNNQIAAIGGTGVAYDAAGEMTNDGSHTYQYDAEGRVASVDSGSTWSFVYNALGERAEWISPGGSNPMLLDPAGAWLGVAGSYSVLREPEQTILYINISMARRCSFTRTTWGRTGCRPTTAGR